MPEKKEERKEKKAFPCWQVGSLVTLNSPAYFVRLDTSFVQPRQIWEPLKIFWGSATNRKKWGTQFDVTLGQPREAPQVLPFPDEWQTAMKMECAWDLGAQGVHQRDICKPMLFEWGHILMVAEVVVTPWKKSYRKIKRGPVWNAARQQRFAYVKFCSVVGGNPIIVYYDISEKWETLEMDPAIFDLIRLSQDNSFAALRRK